MAAAVLQNQQVLQLMAAQLALDDSGAADTGEDARSYPRHGAMAPDYQ